MNESRPQYATEPSKERFLQRNLTRLKTLIITIGVGLLVGSQVYSPNKRIIEAIAGLVVLFMLWQVSTLSALWFVLITYPFPFAMSWGNSNFVFILIIGIMLLIRVAVGIEKFHLDKTLLLPFILIVVSYILSFKNVPLGTRIMRIGLVNTGNFLAAAAFSFFLINAVDDEEKLKKTFHLMLVTGALVIAFNIVELLFPGQVLVPGWLRTRHSIGILRRGIRIKGPFNDFELNAEFFALNSFLFLFMLLRTRRLLTRSLLVIILILDLSMMFATMTRGAFFSLLAGGSYLLFLSRKELNVAKLISIIAGFIFLLVVLNAIVANYTVSGSLFDRVVNTTFEKGLVPDTRTNAWGIAMERGMKHPLFGQGPGWDFAAGINTGVWPHSLYLFYFNSFGIVGLAAFLFLMYRILRATIPGVKASLMRSPFPQAFLKIMHVVIVVFLLDQIKIEYLRNKIYTFFIWTLFAMVIITHNIVKKNRNINKNDAVT